MPRMTRMQTTSTIIAAAYEICWPRSPHPAPRTRTAPTVLPGERTVCGGGALPPDDEPGVRSQLHVLCHMQELIAALGEAACSCDVVDADDVPRERVVPHGDVDGRELRAVTLDKHAGCDLVRRTGVTCDVVGSKPVTADDVAVQGIRSEERR